MAHKVASALPTCCLAFLFLASNALVLSQPSPKSPKISKHPVFLVVSYDGFRADYLNKVSTPALHKLKGEGVSVPYMIPTFPTKTFVNHQSIATGMYSETHGIIDNIVFDPVENKTLSGKSNDPGFWNYHPDVLPLWIRNEQAGDGRTSGCLMWAGSSQPYGPNNDLLPTYYFPGYDVTVTWETRVETVISWLTNETNPANLVFLYYNEPDAHGHGFGPNAAETLGEIAKADNRTAYLVEKLRDAGLFENINLIMLSDHGMQEVTSQRIINVTALIDPSHIEIKHASTPLYELIPKEGRKDEIFNALSQNVSLGYRIWKKEDIPERLRYSSSRRILDLVLLAEPGYAFEDFVDKIHKQNERWNLTESDTREYGVHGYSNETPSMRAYFIARGPAFRKGFEFKPIQNVDVVPLISSVLGLSGIAHNGSFSRVMEMIVPEFIAIEDKS